jgi:NAD(P)-dependent dehydrogenase (short-subunit alcohol dehydrogenase family)
MADGLDDVGRGKAKRLGATDVQCNVSNCTDAKATVSAVMEAFGRVDTLMNKAAICIRCKVLEISQADYDRMMHTDR